jgi:hypothetical protein
MTLEEIIKVADDNYPDGLLQQAHLGEDVGDGLASFIVAELKETYDEDAEDMEQLDTAIAALSASRNQMDGLIEGFEKIRANLVKFCDDD